jgi:hypothetical protein
LTPAAGEPEVIRRFDEFMRVTDFSSASLKGYDPYDLFYWEHRMALWHAWLLLEGDMVRETFPIYNNRRLLAELLSLPFEHRLAASAYHRAMELLWSDVRVVPINPRPEEVTAVEHSRRVTFPETGEESRSHWRNRALVRVTRRGPALRCEVEGTDDESGGQYGGIRFDVRGLSSLYLDFSLLEPDATDTVFVDGYSATGHRCARWRWTEVQLEKGLGYRQAFWFVPGKAVGPFEFIGLSDGRDVVEIHLFLRMKPGKRGGVVVHRAEVSEAPRDDQGG